ncbi:DUF2306 domain-containing protein [Spongiibacter sp.]|uniref:DUF2306 domain-containing protein n=1 Tax=Spongiibacter sp. TaxID=2024860 RepID=UPI0035699761
MNYMSLVTGHLATVVPAMFIRAYQLCQRKGTVPHRSLGKIYMGLMLVTAVITLIMPAYVGPTLLDHFGLIHLLSLLVLHSVYSALAAVKQGDINAHRKHMIGLYIGGILVAGAFTLAPQRLIHGWLFG